MPNDSRMISRHEATVVLYELINSGILDEGLEQDLQEIVTCIEAEEERKMFFWGASNEDVYEMVVARREDLWTPDVVARCEEIEKRLSFSVDK